MKNVMKRKRCLFLALLIAFMGSSAKEVTAAAKKDIYSEMILQGYLSEYTIYPQEEKSIFVYPTFYGFGGTNYTEDEKSAAREKIEHQLVWKTSDSSIVSFVTSYNYENGKRVPVTSDKISGVSTLDIIGLKPGTAKLTVSSKLLDKKLTYKITVKDTGLCSEDVYYANNQYTFQMRGTASAISFASSNPEVATIDEVTGVLTTLKKGKTTISCEASDGNIYKKTIKVQKQGLSYSNITSYYYTGMNEGCYTEFPLVAKGIDVKSWKSSNKKVVTVVQEGNIGILEARGIGKCTVTCTDTSGKTYKCKVTIVGGKTWGGLNGGYRPTLSEVKKHGYYKDINKVQDFGNAVFYIIDNGNEINLNNGNEKLDYDTAEQKVKNILKNRYPDKYIETAVWSDHLIFTSGKQGGEIILACYYVKDRDYN